MTGWAPAKASGNDAWKNRQVIRLDSFTEVRAVQERWKTLKTIMHSALGGSAHALLCYSTRDGRMHVWINDKYGQALDLSGLPDVQWLQDETADLLGSGTWLL